MFNITVEYFTLETIYDVSIKRDNLKTTQDFLIYNWWKTIGHPNVIFHQATMIHDLQNKFNESMESRYYKDFFSKMSKYTKEQQSVYFWSSSPRVREDLVPEKFKNWTKNHLVEMFNKRVRSDLLEIRIEQETLKLNVGLDLYKKSESLKPSAYLDAVHHKPEWYKMVAHQLLSMYCTWRAI